MRLEVNGERRALDWFRSKRNALKAFHVKITGMPLLDWESAFLPEELPAVKNFECRFDKHVTKLPALPSVEIFDIWSCHALQSIPDLPMAHTVSLKSCPSLTAIPAFPSVRRDWLNHHQAGKGLSIEGCPELPMSLPDSSRGHQWTIVEIGDGWFIAVGYNKYFTIAEGFIRWGVGTNPLFPEGNADGIERTMAMAKMFAELHPEVDQSIMFDPFYDWVSRDHMFVALRGTITAARRLAGSFNQ